MESNIKIVIGLGNPGKEYEDTYHNVGFLALDRFLHGPSAEEKITFKTIKHLFAYHKVGDVIWVKPLTFMNESGGAAGEALAYFKITPEAMLVIHDDSDLHVGEYKLSAGASSAGHKGVESIIKQLGTQNFSRLRIGIRPKSEGVAAKRLKAEEFVLRKISKTDEKELRNVFAKIAEAELSSLTL